MPKKVAKLIYSTVKPEKEYFKICERKLKIQ